MKSDLVSVSGDADFLVDFGGVLLGETATRRFRVENVGSAGLSVEFDRPEQPFSGDLPAALSSIDVGSGVDVRFSFRPLEEGPEVQEQVLDVRTNEQGGRTYRLRLRGSGVRAAVHCDPDHLDFGAVLVNSTARLHASCTNPLDLPLEVSLRTFRGNHAMFFSATAEGASGGMVRLDPGQTKDVVVEFQGQSLGENEATLELRDHLQQPIGSLPVSANVVTSHVIVEPVGCLDFSYVNIGSVATKSLTLTNVGNESVRIARIEVPEAHVDDFTVKTALPLDLAPRGGSASVEIDFHPQTGGNRQLALQIWTDEGENAVSACVTGFGGGPALACSPAVRDLGPVAIGFPAIARFQCSNVGAAPEGTPIDPLVVQTLQVDDEVFTPIIRNPDGTTGPRPRGYTVGEGFAIEVAYDPIAEVFDEAVVQVQTNVNRVDLQVAGEGRAVEPCDFSLNPPALRFGVLARNTSRSLELEIRNHGPTSCFVSNLRLSEDTSPVFTLEGFESREIEVGGTLRIPVTFSPTQHAPSLRGTILFEISHPALRYQEVPLSGASANTCLLVEPQDVDFGAASPGCQAIKRTLTVSNVCGTPLEIVSIDLGDSPDLEDFSIVQRPTVPLRLDPQGYAEVEVAFDPVELGLQRGSLEVELASHPSVEENIYLATLFGEGSETSRQTDDFTSVGRPQIDILWVIDNSGSMRSYQQRLQENLPAFMSFATSQRADFQIGVTTTALRFGGSGCPGGADGAENGRLFPIDGSHPRILTSSTPNLEAHWRHNMAVGTCFGPNEESALEGAFQALSPPLINEIKDSRYNSPYDDGNAGFLRPGAALSVILVSDALDYSPQPANAYVEFFLRLKRGRKDQVRVHAISGPRASSPIPGCSTQAGDKMIDVVEATGGTWLSLCTPTTDTEAWRSTLEEMSKGVFAFAKRHILRGIPGDVNKDGKVDEQDIEIRLNGKIEPHIRGTARVWVYDAAANAVDFEPLYIPRTGTTITASYDLACR